MKFNKISNYTLISIIFAFVTLLLMGEMSSDYECKMSYYIPCFIVLFMCVRQICKAGAEWLEQDTWNYYDNRNQKKKRNIVIYGNKGKHVYRERKHYQSYSSYQYPNFEMNDKEVAKKCKRNFTIKIDEAEKSN